MTTLGTVSLERPPLISAEPTKRHARDLADRQPIPHAPLLATLEGLTALAALTIVMIATNRGAMPGGLDNFFAIRITLKNVLLLATLVACWRMVFHACALYTVGGVRVPAMERLRVVIACGIGSLIALIIPLVSVSGGLRVFSIVYFFLLWTASTLALRQTRRAISRRQRSRILIVGTGRLAFDLWQRLTTDQAFDYELVGFLDTPDSLPANDAVARQCLGTFADLEPLLMQHAIDEVCVALPVKSHYLEFQEALRVCERVGVRTKYQADLFESQVAWPRYDDPSHPTVTLHVVPNDYRLVIKRAVDIVGAITALIMLSPIMAIAAIAIKATSEGPVIFAQERYGLNRRRFRMLKFRTMRSDAERLQAALEARNEADGPVFKIVDDPRVTSVGRVLRRTSIDELPQLVNVLRGEMSMVGPRPLPLRDVMHFTSASDMRRFSVLPGLTGLWQVSGRSTLGFADWIRLDLKYIDGWSLALDLVILLRTLPAVLRGSGAH